jgi:selenocysteine lyase/cysteine desulfurase
LLGIDSPCGISLLANATTGVQIALGGISGGLKRGDLVITTDQEHPCVTRPLATLARRGVEVVELAAASEGEFLDRLDSHVKRKRPAFVIISHVSYRNGRIFPVTDAGKILEHDEIPFIVDGAQAFGHIPIDVNSMSAWAYVFSGHKWLRGPWSTGGLWTSPRFVAAARFLLGNWDSSEEPPAGGRYEGGTSHYGVIVGLDQACRQYLENHQSRTAALLRLRAEIETRMGTLFQKASALWGGKNAPGIVSYLTPPTVQSAEFARRVLDRHGVAVKPFRPPEFPDALRISFSYDTNAEEIELLARAIHAEFRAD